jgi:hypothetical protein
MIKKTCDMCGDEGVYLNPLVADYKQDGISEICNKCLKQSNDLFDSCLKAQVTQRTNFIRKFMEKVRKKNLGEINPIETKSDLEKKYEESSRWWFRLSLVEKEYYKKISIGRDRPNEQLMKEDILMIWERSFSTANYKMIQSVFSREP